MIDNYPDFTYFSGDCAYCGEHLLLHVEEYGDGHFDHYIPGETVNFKSPHSFKVRGVPPCRHCGHKNIIIVTKKIFRGFK